MESTSGAVPRSLGHLPVERPYAELTSGPSDPAPVHSPPHASDPAPPRAGGRRAPEPSPVQWASFADAGSPAPAVASAGREPGSPLLRPWGVGSGERPPEAAARVVPAVPAVPVPRGLPGL
ncbi:hypothetical protein ACIOC2_32595 [Streptomyces sp. NPDC088337]|uniref:hypothetical protein n=1 Tax=unclassified Streptomyces TaxID=2593676 RepID=UPI002DDBD68F|nr:hypothetical protein [Streptomyces sp. NBC_01788]WSB24935.1 hypothetical protein OIE49_02990 [Streptomyces sp. NBC_01788]